MDSVASSSLTNLMDDTVPGISSIVDNDVDLAVAKLCGFLNQLVDVVIVEHISRNSNCLAARLVDFIYYILGLLCS